MQRYTSVLSSALLLALLAGCPPLDADPSMTTDGGGDDSVRNPADASGKGASARPRSSVPTVDLSNPYVGARIGFDGRFDMGAFQPIPWDIMYHWPDDPFTSVTTIRIDGVDCKYGEAVCAGAALTDSPHNPDGVTDVSTWQVGPISVTQTLRLTTGLGTLNPDTVRIQYDVANNDTATHAVGLRLLMDTEINGDDGALYRVPGLAAVVSSERELTPPSIPQYYQAFVDLSDRVHVAEGILGALDATLPDRFAMVSWEFISVTDYDYQVIAGTPFGSDPNSPDSAVALYWNPQAIPAGESRTYITYYGLGSVSGSDALGLSGPAQLQGIQTHWSPNPFTVIAYLKNNRAATMAGESLTLGLVGATGLALAAGETATHPVGNILPGDTVQTSWSVLATAAGTWTYSASDASASPLVAERTIIVPPVWACIPEATQGCATGLLGVCAQGQQTCTDTGVWGPCVQTVQPSPEICNDGLDNDCDGLIDAADPDCQVCTPNSTRACATGLLGVCALGKQTCSPSGLWGPCAQEVQPSHEVCNDCRDNDCDGLVDGADPDCWQCAPGATKACLTHLPGVCAHGRQTCNTAGVWGSCQQTVKPSHEVCNDGLDNDCDGLVDGADPDCAGKCPIRGKKPPCGPGSRKCHQRRR